MFRIVLTGWFLLAMAGALQSQAGFTIPRGRGHVDIPFEYINNFIVVNIQFGGYLPLKFIFDTGAEHTILTKREISDLLNITYEREFRVTGSDLKTILIAYLARRVELAIPEKTTAPSEDILVLNEDYFRFEEYAGVNVHGVLAAVAFSKYLMKIDYARDVLTLYDPRAFNPLKNGFTPLPIELFRNKMYLNTTLEVLPDSVASVKLLIDTGAGLPLLLFNNTHPLIYPPPNILPSNIGMGLGGYLEGATGRIHGVVLGDFFQQNIITYFQTLDSTVNHEGLNFRNGLIGNTLLSRFEVILDYSNSLLWLKPGKFFKDEYVYDRSGMSLISTGPRFSDYIVQNIIAGSPADEAGILRGDQIVRVRLMPASFFSLTDIQHFFQKKPGTKVKITIKRNGKRLRKTIVLRDLI